jgi:hypothetical protein
LVIFGDDRGHLKIQFLKSRSFEVKHVLKELDAELDSRVD